MSNRISFTKMHGAGNDFVVINGVNQTLHLSPEQLRRIGHRQLGIGADQILWVEPALRPEVDFRYRIFNGSTGLEVEHCGNGARCFARYVRDHGLINRDVIRVDTMNNTLELHIQPDGRVTVNMNQPRQNPDDLPFDTSGLTPQSEHQAQWWTLPTPWSNDPTLPAYVRFIALSMGNPHAVLWVNNCENTPVATIGAWLESHPRFTKKVNVGFAQLVSPSTMNLRVFERDAGETWACGTGACAAAVSGMALGWLNHEVEVRTRGGDLRIGWAGDHEPVYMTGPAVTVFEGEFQL